MRFENDAYLYTVHAGVDRMFGDETEADHLYPFFGGVEVTRNGRAIAGLSRNREKAQASWGGLLEAKRALGLDWDYGASQWHRFN